MIQREIRHDLNDNNLHVNIKGKYVNLEKTNMPNPRLD